MALRKAHEIHSRRFSRNAGVGLTLGAFVVIIFGLTMVKVKFIDVAAGYRADSGLEAGTDSGTETDAAATQSGTANQ
ncbi:MAG: hypothetical protein ACC631_10155 [Halocynthiibacter sp.]